MLIGLVTKIIPLEKVEDGADFLIEIMPILAAMEFSSFLTIHALLSFRTNIPSKTLFPMQIVEDGADFLIEIMPILFVPPTVGLIANVEALRQMLVPLFVISITTTILIMAVTGSIHIVDTRVTI